MLIKTENRLSMNMQNSKLSNHVNRKILQQVKRKTKQGQP